MRQGGARWARSIALVCFAFASAVPLARSQDLAPAPAAPLPVPEELAPSPIEVPSESEVGESIEPPSIAGIEPPAVVDEPAKGEPEDAGSTNLKYLLQRVQVVGNQRTRTHLIKSFVPIAVGASLDVNDPEIEALRYRLLGTGWYDRVDLRLERGSQPGWVVLVIEVEERSTLVFQQLAAGVGWSVESIGSDSGGEKTGRRAEPYLGLAIAETNLLGTGRTLGGELIAARDQLGVALTFFTPVVRFSRWSLRTRASFVNGREYFGGDNGVVASTSCNEAIAAETDCKFDVDADAAAVHYFRTGLGVGTARDVGSFTRVSLEWHADLVKVPPSGMPDAAFETRGRGVLAERPIDFSIEPGFSKVSMLTVGLTYDKRDSAVLPSSGTLAAFNGDLASGLTGSDYEFVRLQASYNHWFSLPWGHTIRLGAFAGAVFGSTPFFYKFFVSDLTDLQPSRILGLNLDHRPAPNLLAVPDCGLGAYDRGSSCGTAIAQMRQEELAGRVDSEYVWPLVRGRRKFVKGADAFFLFGIYGLADPKDLRVPMPGYQGASRIPIDLTFDAGVRLDTRIGVFQIGLAKLLWLTVR